MKKSALFIVAVTAFLSFSSYGQVYENIYANSSVEIQSRIDQNKMSGLDILTGIQTHHVIGISGMAVSQLTELQNVLNNEPQILAFTVNSDATSVVIDSKGWFTRDKFVSLTHPMNILVTGYTATYSIND